MKRSFLRFFYETHTKSVAILPGGFKPPTKGHFNALQYILQDADRGIVFIGKKERDGITAEQSQKIWQIYGKYTIKPIDIQISPISPVKSVYDYADSHTDSKIIVGAGSKDEDIKRFNYFEKHIDKYPLVQIVKIPIQSEGISGTITREKILTNINDAINYFVPDEVISNKSDVKLIKSILTSNK